MKEHASWDIRANTIEKLVLFCIHVAKPAISIPMVPHRYKANLFCCITSVNDRISKESSLYPTMADENGWFTNIQTDGILFAQHDNFPSCRVLFR